ncbi:low molecular weight phosphotyrosine protein phosphatase [Caenimonas sedimenti]|uniref:protein-tyrosine-phosphatase n=1 Tax=Caenimonas sedimenti TaxID=2596921 RepID=A0A562ZUL8_9BURK|nr:low molecular weight protein-tyrosine-phosphatase [Caenimonas sedimenti]TWO72290.1 low molecular weight phosphotyrosine protein phosphatase [Caenimonas sedimenti]
MKHILTVCIGNICRSPMAQALLAHALPDATVASAGTAAMVGMPADEGAQRLMQARGLDISKHRAMQVHREVCRWADLILVMDTDQKKELEQAYPVVLGKVFRIGEHAKRDVPDPYKRGEAAFRDALAIIDDGAQQWLQRIRKL